MLVRSPSVTRLAEEGEERLRRDRVGCEETLRASDGEGENFKREREDYLRARARVCVKLEKKGDRIGAAARETTVGDEEGRSGVSMESRRESVRAGW